MKLKVPELTYRCSYCETGHIRKEDLPCACPHCGKHLTKIITVSKPPPWVADIQKQEDERFLAELERTIAYTSSGNAIPDTPRKRC